jgi:hypothetical protein
MIIDKSNENTFTAWRAYDNARKLGEAVPDEVIRYLDGAAHQLVKIAGDPAEAKTRPLRIAEALGLAKKGAGAASVFKDYSNRQRARKIAIETFEEMKKYDKEYGVFEDIAEKHKVSGAKVRRDYKEHLKRWRMEIDNLIKQGLVEIETDGVTARLRIVGTSDDLREGAILLSLIKERLKNNPT